MLGDQVTVPYGEYIYLWDQLKTEGSEQLSYDDWEDKTIDDQHDTIYLLRDAITERQERLKRTLRARRESLAQTQNWGTW